LEILHKAALYAVLTFVIVGAAISLAGPGSVPVKTATSEANRSQETITADRDMLATKGDKAVAKAGT